MSAPPKNKNASKPASVRASALLRLRCRSSQKAAYQRAARGRGLTQWALEHLDLAAQTSGH